MHIGIAPLALACLLGLVQTQPASKLTQFGTKTERGSTRLAYWDNEKNEAVGQVAIDYGRPVWKDGYDTQLDAMTRGKIWRMGENFWTSLDTSLPVSIGGVEIPVGYYYLAVERSADGADWELLVVDPASVRERFLDAYEVGTRPSAVPVRLRVPLAFERREGEGGERTEKLDIELTEDRLLIAWGDFALSAPVAVKGP